MDSTSFLERNNWKSQLTFFIAIGFSLILLSSCGSSKAATEIIQSYDYKVKIVHIENRNSTYDNLVSNFNESNKSPDLKIAEAFAKDTLINMAKTACLGRCPVYAITIYNSGIAKYEGTENVEMKGILQSKLDESQLEKLRAMINEIDLLKMYNRYPRGVTIVGDVQSIQLILSDGKLKFPTEIYYGQPQELTNVQLYLDQLVSELSWVQI